MENFLVFRCSPCDELKLVYFMIVFGCDIPILEALFYTSMGFYAWPCSYPSNFSLTCLKTLKHKVEIHKNIQSVYFAKDDMYYDDNEYGARALSLWRDRHHGKTHFIVTISFNWSKPCKLRLFIKKKTRGKLQIAVTKSDELLSKQAFRFGQIDATLDAHLKLLFGQ